MLIEFGTSTKSGKKHNKMEGVFTSICPPIYIGIFCSPLLYITLLYFIGISEKLEVVIAIEVFFICIGVCLYFTALCRTSRKCSCSHIDFTEEDEGDSTLTKKVAIVSLSTGLISLLITILGLWLWPKA